MLRIARALAIDLGTYDSEALYLALRRTTEGAPAEVEARIHDFAGLLLEGLVQFAPVGYGNEELARHAVARFYEGNGWVLDPDEARLHQLVAEVGSGQASVVAAAAVLRSLAQPATPPG